MPDDADDAIIGMALCADSAILNTSRINSRKTLERLNASSFTQLACVNLFKRVFLSRR